MQIILISLIMKNMKLFNEEESKQMDFIFNKDDIRKLELFSYLENTYDQSATQIEIQNKFEWSKFITVTTINSLAEDLVNEGLDNYYLIKIKDKKITLQKNGLDSIDHLLLLYAENSTQFQMLNAMFMQPDFNLEFFTDSLFLSEATGYRTKRALDDMLQKVGFHLTQDFQLAGSEENIRMFFYKLYLDIYKNYSFPFNEDVNRYSNLFVNQLIDSLNLELTQMQLLKLKYFSAVLIQSLTSERTNTNIEDVPYVTTTNSENTIPTIFACLQENPGIRELTEDQLTIETRFILNFLYIEGMIDVTFNTSPFFSQIESLNTFVIKDLQKYFDITLNEKNYISLFDELSRIHFASYYSTPIEFSWQVTLDNTILKENYGFFYLFVDQLISNLKTSNPDIFGNKIKNISHLKSEYLFLFIRYIDLSTVLKPVHVTIDFSKGNNYNDLIHKNLDSLPFFNIEVSYSLTAKTDIYLSDFLMADVSSHYLIWNSPPLASDWEIFANMIVDIRTNGGGGTSNVKKL